MTNKPFCRWLQRIVFNEIEADYNAGYDWADNELLCGTDPWVVLEFCEPETSPFDRGARDRLKLCGSVNRGLGL